MDSMEQKAAYLRVGLRLGVHTVSDVIRWVDSEIECVEEPPITLIELSLMGKANPHEVLEMLYELSAGVSTFNVLRKILGQAHRELVEHPRLGPIFARGLCQIYVESGYEVPDDLRPIGCFKDRFDLARQGTYGTEADVFEDLLKFTAGFDEIDSKQP